MNGSCLCGDVSWSTSAAARSILECHCERCRRMTGNYMAATAVTTRELDVTGQSLRWYSPADDSNIAYGFCSNCGSSLFFRSGITDDTNEITSICAGSIHGAHALSTSEIWFADDAGDHVRIDRSEAASIAVFGGQPPA